MKRYKPVAAVVNKQHIQYPIMSTNHLLSGLSVFAHTAPSALNSSSSPLCPSALLSHVQRRAFTNHPGFSPIFPHLWSLSMHFPADLCAFSQSHTQESIKKAIVFYCTNLFTYPSSLLKPQKICLMHLFTLKPRKVTGICVQ